MSDPTNPNPNQTGDWQIEEEDVREVQREEEEAAALRRANGDEEEDEEEDAPINEGMADEEEAQPKLTAAQLAQIAEFKGDRDVDDFIRELEIAARNFGWTDAQICTAAQHRLRGIAAKWLKNQEKSQLLRTEWANPNERLGLKEAMLTRFGKRVTVLEAVNLVSNLKQKENQTVDDFFDDVFDAVDRHNFTYTLEQKKEDAYQGLFRMQQYTYYWAGLKDQIKSKVSGARPPANIDELLQFARNVEKELKMTTEPTKLQVEETSGINAVYRPRGSGRGNRGSSRGGFQSRGGQQQRGGFQPRGGQARGRGRGWQQPSQQQHQQQQVCFHCGMPGHFKQDCPVMKFQIQNNISLPGNQNNRGRRRGSFRGSFGGNWRVNATEEGDEQAGYEQDEAEADVEDNDAQDQGN